MELSDALTITVLGMAVVFSGLLLTAGLIVVFGRVQPLLDRPAEPATEPAPAADRSGPGEQIGADIVCVIATVLEIERRLHRLGGHRRPAAGPASEPSHE